MRRDEIDKHPDTQTQKTPLPSFFSLSPSLSLFVSLSHTLKLIHTYNRPVLLGFILSAILRTISHQKYVRMR